MPAISLHSPQVHGFLLKLRVTARGRRFAWRPVITGGILGFSLFSLMVVGQVLGDNLHEVQPGRAYRSGQLSPDRLGSVVERHGIRTVVNLRGCCPGFDWYQQQAIAAHAFSISHEDVFLSAIRLPSPSELLRLVEILDRSEQPLLLHCRQGVDRTGLASVVYKLLQPEYPLAEAADQLSVRFGYLPVNGTQNMRRFVRLYEAWLEQRDVQHSPNLFRHWATREYCPGACRAEYEPADLQAWQAVKSAHRATTLKLSVRNASVQAWRFRSGPWRAVHARYSIKGSDGRVVYHERAGLFEKTVGVHERADLEIGLPPLPPGRYRLWLDMIDVDENAFCQFGCEPFAWEFQVQ